MPENISAMNGNRFFSKDPLKTEVRVWSDSKLSSTHFFLRQHLRNGPGSSLRSGIRIGAGQESFSNLVVQNWSHDGRLESRLAWILSRHNFYCLLVDRKITIAFIALVVSVAFGLLCSCCPFGHMVHMEKLSRRKVVSNSFKNAKYRIFFYFLDAGTWSGPL